jgi:hypothetical protein
MADGFAKSAQNTADWVRHLRDTGQLKEWMQQGLNVLHDLWQIGKDLIGILDDLSGHKGPSSGLMDDIKTLVHDARDLADVLGVVLGWVNKLTDWIMSTRPDFSHLFDSLGTGVGNGWNLVTGSSFWHWLVTPQKGPDFGHLFDSIGTGVGNAWNTIIHSSFWRWLVTPQQGPDFGRFFEGLWNSFKSVVNLIADAWNSLHFSMPSFNILGWHTPSFTVTVPQLPHWMAAGGVASGGPTWVGEQGPELVNLPSGAQVLPHSNAMAAAAGGGAATTHVVQLEFVGSPGDPLLEWLRNAIRVRGGNVQEVVGQGS